MQEIIELVSNYGIGITCVVYLIYFQNTTMREMLNTLNTMNTKLQVIETQMEEYHGHKD